MRHFDIDMTAASIFGFSDAGWTGLEKILEREGKKIYTTTTNILPVSESIYWRHHDAATIERKAVSIHKEPKSVEAALGVLAGIFLRIQHEETRGCLQFAAIN